MNVQNIAPVPIVLDKPRNLRMTLGGMKRFQDVTGKSLLKGEFDSSNESDLIVFVWSCLIWEDKTLSPEDVGYMLDFARLHELTEAIAKAWSISIPKKEGESPNP
jgi:hypothetical protein